MNIICEKNILNKAVTPALSAISNKNAFQAVISGFLLTADKDNGTLVISSYDLEKGVKVTVSGDDIQINESGQIIVNAEKFSSIVKNMPDGNISVNVDSNLTVNIKNGRSEFALQGLDGSTFPQMPELKGEKNFTLPRKTLKNMITSIIFSVAGNSSRPSITGAFFEINNNQLNIVGTDGSRMAVRRCFEGLTSSEELNISFIIPQKSLSELVKLIGDENEPAAIELTKKHIMFSFDNIVFFSRLIENEYIDYKRAIKTDPKTTVIINTKNFMNSLERAAVLTEDKQKTLISLNFKKEEINIENKDEAGIVQINAVNSLGKVHDECDMDIYGDDLVIGFNQWFLYEAFRAVKEEKVLVKLENATKSLVILPYDDETKNINIDIYNSKFLYLVLPVRMHN